MRTEVKALKELFDATPLGAAYSSALFSKLSTQIEDELATRLKVCIDTYSEVQEVHHLIQAAKDWKSKLTVLILHIPCSFLLCFEPLFNNPKTERYARYLLIPSLNHVLNSLIEEQKHFRVFLQAIGPRETAEGLHHKVALPDNTSCMAWHLHKDMMALGKMVNSWAHFDSIQEKIEMYYLTSGLYAFSYRFYFDILCNIPDQNLIKAVHQIFLPLFASLRKYEITYLIKETPTIRKLKYYIEKDDAIYRHRVLRKHIFHYYQNYNPLVQDGSVISTNVVGQRILQRQLEFLNSMSMGKLMIFLKDIRSFRGPAYLNYLLVNIQRTGNERIFDLKTYLTDQGREQPGVDEILTLVEQFVEKLGSGVHVGHKSAELLSTQMSDRSHHAKNIVMNNKGRKMMDHTHVAAYLAERLKKLYERCKIKGALTYDKIPDYLASLAAHTDQVLDQSASAKDLADFELVAQELMADLVGPMDPEMVKRHQEALKKETTNLRETDNLDERAGIVSVIGIHLIEADEEVQEIIDAPVNEQAFEEPIVSIGLEENAPLISVNEFLCLPLAQEEPSQDDWFEMHRLYLDLLREKRLLTEAQHNLVFNQLDEFPKKRFTKYFDIFPHGVYEDTVMMAVFSLWKNMALENLQEIA